MFQGAITALVTPMNAGNVDLPRLRNFVEWQISEGIDGLVACGTTGETPTLTQAEQLSVIRTVVEQAKNRVPVIAGAGANSTAKAIELSKLAKEAGVDGLLHVTPYYNKPTQPGLVAHFRAIAAAVELPIVLYNVPGRTACDLAAKTVLELCTVPHIVAIKESSGLLTRAQEILASCPKSFCLLTGDDALSLATTAIGGRGVISVVSNVTPRWMHTLVQAARSGDSAQAQDLFYKQLRLMDLMFVQSNPIPVKAAVSLLGFTENSVRLPLLPLQGEPFEQVKQELKTLGLIK